MRHPSPSSAQSTLKLGERGVGQICFFMFIVFIHRTFYGDPLAIYLPSTDRRADDDEDDDGVDGRDDTGDDASAQTLL